MHAVDGDPMNRDTLAAWRSRILARRMVVSGGGPPRETWSASRLADGPDPPPLRTHDQFLGKTAGSERQREHLWVGNALCHAMHELFALHTRRLGRHVGSSTPSRANGDLKPSARLPAIRRVLSSRPQQSRRPILISVNM
eukprot:9498852-Pyramimonas_sp.AAC.1